MEEGKRREEEGNGEAKEEGRGRRYKERMFSIPQHHL